MVPDPEQIINDSLFQKEREWEGTSPESRSVMKFHLNLTIPV